jgi:translocation and assembly module TamA
LLLLPLAGHAEPVSVRIEGLDGRLEQNVRALLSIAGEQSEADPARLRAAHGRAGEEIRKALQPYGYYKPSIETELRREGARWVATYRVEPGPPIRVGTLDVRLAGEAEAVPDLQALVAGFPLKPGGVLEHEKYNRGKGAFENLATEYGFFEARFTRHEIRVSLEPYRADIHLHFDSGPRYRFGPVSFSESPLRPELLHRFVEFEPGQPYRASALLTLQKHLFDSGYFARADVLPRPEPAADHQAPVEVTLGMQPEHRFQAGVGYGTDTGPRLTLGYRNRYLNAAGHSWQSFLRLSFLRYELEALYAIPLRRPYQDQLAFSAQAGLEDTVAGTAEVLRAGVRHSTTRWGLREVLSLDAHRENYDLGEGGDTTFLLMPGAAYTWLRADDPLHPDRGLRLDLLAAGAHRSLLSDASFLRLRLNGKGVHRLGENNRLIARGQLGYIVTDDFGRLPLTQRFYAGGDQSVRGYRFNEISPENANGDRTGGQILTVGSLEYERTLFGDWGLAAFFDAGQVSDRFTRSLRYGTGLGVRWRSPVGPVRLDFAVPLSKAEDSFQVHLILGPDL